jgi:hypothetical protein
MRQKGVEIPDGAPQHDRLRKATMRQKERVMIGDGYQQSQESLREILHDTKVQSLQTGSLPIIGHGAISIRTAWQEPEAGIERSRCRLHRMGNVMNALATLRRTGLDAIHGEAAKMSAPLTGQRLAAHGSHSRASNSAKSTFATVHRRHTCTRNCTSPPAFLKLAGSPFKDGLSF